MAKVDAETQALLDLLAMTERGIREHEEAQARREARRIQRQPRYLVVAVCTLADGAKQENRVAGFRKRKEAQAEARRLADRYKGSPFAIADKRSFRVSTYTKNT